MKNKGSRTDPWGMLCFVVPQADKKNLNMMMILIQLIFSFQLDRMWTNLRLLLNAINICNVASIM